MSAVKNLLTLSLLLSSTVAGAAVQQTKGDYIDKFRQLDEELPTPNVYRNAAGEPGQQYWQQQVDYQIKARLDESKRRLSASQQVTYRNNSPYTLKYLWLQLDQNVLKNDSMAEMTDTFGAAELRDGKPARISLDQLRRQQFMADTELGYSINKLVSDGKALRYVIVGTLNQAEQYTTVNARMVDIQTNTVVAAASDLIPAEVLGATEQVQLRQQKLYRQSDN